jgi:flagellar hook assembly protein FlgD
MPVRTLVARDLPAGIQTVQWDGADDQGLPVASGTYFYRLRVGSDFEETRAMTLLR